MKLNKKYLSLIIIFLNLSCVQNKYLLEYKNFNILSEQCKDEFFGYFIFNNVQISNYYYNDNKIGGDFDKNGIMDSIALICPKQYNLFKFKTDCNINDKDDLLLIVSQNNKKPIVYNTVISNKPILNGEENIIKSKNGFIIKGDWGHSGKKLTKVFVNYYNNSFFIDSINVESDGHIQYKEKKKYKRNEFSLKNYSNKYLDSLIADWDKKNGNVSN